MKFPGKEFWKWLLLAAVILAVIVAGIFLLWGAETLFDGYRQGLTDVYINK